MKINANPMIKNYTADILLHAKESVSSAPVREHKFDAITIQSDPRQIEQVTFAKAVSRELSSRISKPVSEDRVQELKSQIQSNSYSIDACAIASRMLLVQEARTDE